MRNLSYKAALEREARSNETIVALRAQIGRLERDLTYCHGILNRSDSFTIKETNNV